VAVAVPAFHLVSLLLMFLVARAITSKRDKQVGEAARGGRQRVEGGRKIRDWAREGGINGKRGVE
jgi:hypothetical protein